LFRPWLALAQRFIWPGSVPESERQQGRF